MVGNASGCFKNGIILTSLTRNFFTDLRKASVDMPKPQFASSISQSANDFLSSSVVSLITYTCKARVCLISLAIKT